MFSTKTISGALKRLARLAGVVALAATVAGGPALADGRGHDRGEGRWAREGRDGRWAGGGERWARDGRDGGRWARDRGEWRGPPRGRGYGYDYGYGPPRGYPSPYMEGPRYPSRPIPPGIGLRRGGMIPPEYRGAVVPDYGRHRLRPPPPGFGWVRMGDRYLLVSRSTGQIFDVIGD